MTGQAKVQGNDSAPTDVERLVEFWHIEDHGRLLDDAAAEVLAGLTGVVPRAVAEALAEALEWIAARGPYTVEVHSPHVVAENALQPFRAIYPKAEEESHNGQ